jgi:uncharacterized membrane protein YtjA (UPF0391 family)
MLPPGTRFSKAQLADNFTRLSPTGIDESCCPGRMEPVPHPGSYVRIAWRCRCCGGKTGGWTVTLLKWALIFFLVSVVAGILGFTGISAASADVARFLFYVFVVIFLVLLILGLTIFRV